MLCSICNDEINTGEHIKFKLCNEYLHFVCAGFRESVFKKISEISKKSWICSSCKPKDKSSTKPLAQNVVNNNVSTFSNDTIETLVKSVEFMSEQFDIFKNQVKEIFSTLKQIQSENKLIKDQNIELSAEVLQLNKRINSLEQRSIENNIELVGVPESVDESCVDIVNKIASNLNVEIVVHNAYRVFSGKNKNPRKIVASINSKESRHQLLTQSKKMKIKANQLHQEWENNNIYINEQMTQVNRNLFYKAKNIAREVGFKFIWFKNSKIFAKKQKRPTFLLLMTIIHYLK